jgi:hypothetical protein
LENAADLMARELLGIAVNGESESVRLQAIRDALDRAGLKPTESVVLSAGNEKPWEAIMFDGIAGGSRAESRARRNFPNNPTEPIGFEIQEPTAAPASTRAPLREPDSEDLDGGHRRYRIAHVTGYEALEK